MPQPQEAQKQSEFDRLCRVVERGMAAWVEVGIALTRIRDERLYQLTHETFEAFVNERFDLTRRRAYQMMSEAVVAREHGLETGAQARALATVAPERREEVLATARASGELSARAIAQVAGGLDPEAWVLVAISQRIASCAEDLRALEGKPLARWLPLDRVVTVLARAGALVDAAVPDTQCGRCEGRGCIDCGDIGWIPSRLNAMEDA